MSVLKHWGSLCLVFSGAILNVPGPDAAALQAVVKPPGQAPAACAGTL